MPSGTFESPMGHRTSLLCVGLFCPHPLNARRTLSRCGKVKSPNCSMLSPAQRTAAVGSPLESSSIDQDSLNSSKTLMFHHVSLWYLASSYSMLQDKCNILSWRDRVYRFIGWIQCFNWEYWNSAFWGVKIASRTHRLVLHLAYQKVFLDTCSDVAVQTPNFCDTLSSEFIIR